jgi:hypothetical protein
MFVSLYGFVAYNSDLLAQLIAFALHEGQLACAQSRQLEQLRGLLDEGPLHIRGVSEGRGVQLGQVRTHHPVVCRVLSVRQVLVEHVNV